MQDLMFKVTRPLKQCLLMIQVFNTLKKKETCGDTLPKCHVERRGEGEGNATALGSSGHGGFV